LLVGQAPATAAGVAAAVGDRDTLDLLAALVEADSLATGPSAWGSWKAGLVAQLVDLTAAVLSGQPRPGVGAATIGPEQEALLRAGQRQLLADGGRVTVAAPDRRGLLATVAGVLTLHGVTIRSAATISDPATNMALLRFEVSPAFDRLPDWDRVEADLDAALDARIVLAELLERREQHYARYRRAASAAAPEVRVAIDNSASAVATVVEVRTVDRGPVLYDLANAVADAGLTITSALINTLGAEVIDVFYVQTLAGGQVTDPGAQRQLLAALEAAL